MGKDRKKDLIIFILLFAIAIIIMIAAMYLLYYSFNEGEEVSIVYNDESNLKYSVLLKEKGFYEEAYLSEDYNIVASLIDKINVSFEYLFNTSKAVTGEAYYTVNSTIVAYQKSDNSKRKVWDYNKLIRDKSITRFDVSTTTMNLSNNFEIDYAFYQKMMEEYQKKYSVSLTGDLVIEIGIKTEFNYEEFDKNVDLPEKSMLLTIPLTDSIIEIKKSIPDRIEQELIEKKPSNINYLKLFCSFIALFCSIYISAFLGKTIVKIFGIDSKYEKELKKILRTYDYIIVNIKNFDISKEEKILYVDSFDNLLDAQSELRAPILYCNIIPKKEDIFIVKYEKDLLIYKMESKLYEKNNVQEAKVDEI